MKWSAPGCRGTFYRRGKYKTIYYYVDRKRTSLRLIFSKKNKEIAAEIIRQKELSGIEMLDQNRPQDLETAWELFRKTFIGRKSFTTINNTRLGLNKLLGDNYNIENTYRLTDIIEGNITNTELMPRSVNSYLGSLKAFFNWLKEKNYISDNPIKKSLKLKVPDKKIETYTGQELQAIFDYWENKNHEIFLFLRFLYETAFRINEALSLTWKQVKYGKKWHTDIFLPSSKYGDRTDTFPLTAEIRNILKQVKSHSESHDGDSLIFSMPNKRNINRSFDKALKALAIPKHIQYASGNGRAIHTLRKTRISHWVEKQLLPETVVEKLSRDKYETVRKYYANLDGITLSKHMKSFSEIMSIT